MLRFILLSILICSTLIACESPSESKEIVFVCTHGAARSPIAAAHFNKLAKDNELNFHAVFRGTEPDDVLSTATIGGLTSDGFDVSNWKPEKVSNQDIQKAYKVVTFDCSVPSENSSALTAEWNGTPSISKDYSTARDAIYEHVEKLIAELKKE